MLSRTEQFIFKNEIRKLSEDYMRCANDELKNIIKNEIIDLSFTLTNAILNGR